MNGLAVQTTRPAWRAFCALCLLYTSASATPSGRNYPVLRRAADIHALSTSEAAKGYPVHLRAAVTYYDPEWQILFVHDGASGIYVDPGENDLHLRAGTSVEIDGHTDPGQFAPMVIARKVRATGQVTLPFARETPLHVLSSGVEDSQWVAVRGLVRSATIEYGHLYLKLALGG